MDDDLALLLAALTALLDDEGHDDDLHLLVDACQATA